MKINIGDKVRVKDNAEHSAFIGVQGFVMQEFEETGGLIVALENGPHKGFWPNELELVDEKLESLIRLAESLDTARQQANAIDLYVIQHQQGVYGQIALALHDTLEQIIENEDENNTAEADKLYQSILDGNSVREALKAWEASK